MNYEILPEHIRGGMQRYIENCIPPGDFLTAVICNDLKNSFGLADDINKKRLFDIVNFMYNEAPSLCWGSYEKMNSWLSKGLK